MYTPYPNYAVSPSPYIQYVSYPMPETKDQFIRRFVSENFHEADTDYLITKARYIWDESYKVNK